MKKRILSVCLMLGLATIFTYAQKPWDNGRLMISSNNRYLQFENGSPFFWLGDTGWLVPQHLDRSEVEYYFNKCRRAGYNMVQIQVMDAVPSYNIYGQQSLPYGWDFTKADPEGVYSYWDHLDYIVRKAEQNGIYIGMVAIWGSQIQAGNINAEQAKAYGKFLAERYKNNPNIIWIMGGDIQGNIHPEVWNALATSIKSIDNKHLMTFHPRGRYTSAKWWSKASWMDFHTFQSGHRKYGQRMGNKDYPIPDSTEEDNWMYVDSTWAYKPIKPVLDDEPSYEDIPKGLHDANEARWQDYDVRRYAYWSVFAGSCGHTYGHNVIMQMLKPGYPTGYGSDGTVKAWYQGLEDPGYNQMQYLSDLMLSFPFFERIPDQSIIVGKNGMKYDRLIATRGKDYLMVYNYNSNFMKIDLRKISGKKKLLWWFNPSDGAISFIGTADNTIITMSPQIEKTDKINDRVLIAIDAEKNYISREQVKISNQRIADRKRNLNE